MLGEFDRTQIPILEWMDVPRIPRDWSMLRSLFISLGSNFTLQSFCWSFLCRQILSRGASAVGIDVSGREFGCITWDSVVYAAQLHTVAGLRDYLRQWKFGVAFLAERSKVCVKELNCYSHPGAWLSDYLFTIYQIGCGHVDVHSHYTVVTNRNYFVLLQEILSVDGLFPELAELAIMSNEVRVGDILESLSWQVLRRQMIFG